MEIKEFQALLYQLLEDINKSFNQLGTEYYLAYGTLLGAKRHKGFIPWDDDIDLFVKREDFMELCEKYNKVSKISHFYYIDIDTEYYFPFAKVSLTTTRSVYKTPNTPLSLGVSVDIFPLDYLPNNKLKRELCFYYMKLLNRSIGTYHIPFANLKSHKDELLWLFGKINGYRRLVKMSKWFYTRLNKTPKKWIGNVVWGSYHHNDIFPTEFLGKNRIMDFENLKLNVPEKTEELLTLWYKNYMELPTQEEIEQCSHHFNELYERI